MKINSLVLFIFCSAMFGNIHAQNSGFNPDNYLNKEFRFGEWRTLDNQKISSNDLKGKPTLINFWYTSCKPCIEEMPMLNQIKSRFLDSVNYVAITYEPKGKVLKFLERHTFDFIQIINAKSLTDSFGMRAYPINIFLDKNGIAVNIEIGVPHVEAEDGTLSMRDSKDFESILANLLMK
jgi:cytochrome c biogenesis protein CcmG, thiol:disulfide interchange protein DsbE